MATGVGGTQYWRTAYPSPAAGIIGWALFILLGSSLNGLVSRENGVPGGTTTNGPAGLGGKTYTEPHGVVIPWSPKEGEGPNCPVSGVGLARVRLTNPGRKPGHSAISRST